MVDILKKTWRKMSDKARKEALGLSLSPPLKDLISRAIAT